MYEYRIVTCRVIDGDTIEATLDLGFGTFSCQKFRLHSIDTPETYGVKKNSEEWKAGMLAKEDLISLLQESNDLTVKTYKDKQGKYGRYIARLISDVHGDISLKMKELGHDKNDKKKESIKSTNNTRHIKVVDGTYYVAPNEISSEERSHYISYNNHNIAIYGSDTTAIVRENPLLFLILNGDHREALKGLNYQDCVAYFNKNKHLRNSYSEDE